MSGDRPFVVGVTGGLGSGKSAVCALLAAAGLPVIDADEVARGVTAPGAPALAELAAAFGADVIDEKGALRREVVASRGFRSAETRQRLEAILHPHIQQALAAEVTRLGAAGHAAVVIEAALILEAGRQDFYDMLVVVTAPEASKVERAVARGMSPEEARRRLAHQWPDDRKIHYADRIIDNGGDRAALAAQAADLARDIRARAAVGSAPRRRGG